jgi:hypothetical protein
MRAYRKYSSSQIEEAVRLSKSWRQVILFLNPESKGYRGSETAIKKAAIKFKIDFSHFPGSRWNLGKKFGPKVATQDYLNGKFVKSNDLKKRLFQDGLKERKCEWCQLVNWNNEEIPLELHHKDKNPRNNQLENLEVLCPNCHYCRHKQLNKISKSKKLKSVKPRKMTAICKCGLPAKFKYCSKKCSSTSRRTTSRPSKEELEKLVWQKPSLQIAKDLGLKSSTNINKWCKQYGISKPPRGHWEKIYHGRVDQEQESQVLET